MPQQAKWLLGTGGPDVQRVVVVRSLLGQSQQMSVPLLRSLCWVRSEEFPRRARTPPAEPGMRHPLDMDAVARPDNRTRPRAQFTNHRVTNYPPLFHLQANALIAAANVCPECQGRFMFVLCAPTRISAEAALRAATGLARRQPRRFRADR